MAVRVPQLNPRTVKMARDFAKHQEKVLALLKQLGWKGDEFELHKRLIDLKMTWAPRLEAYLEKCAFLRRELGHNCRMPKQPQYVIKVLGTWKP